MKAKYIALDLESGGIGHDKSLLTAYIAVLDEDLNPFDSTSTCGYITVPLDLKMKPDDGVYKVEAEALAINKIDILSHDREAITYKEAAKKIFEYLEQVNPGGKEKLIPLGHNVAFDIQFLTAHTLSKKTWDKYVSYRTLDTGTIGQYLIAKSDLPDMKASLGEIAKHYGVRFAAHTAKGDTEACIEIMKKMLRK